VASAWRAIFSSHDSDGTLFINTFGVKMDPISGDGLNPTDLASAVNDWFGDEYVACLGTSLTLDTITVDSFPTAGEQGVFARGSAGTVSVANDIPRELAAIFSWKTDNATRSGRGHIAFPLPRGHEWLNGSSVNYSTLSWGTTVQDLFDALDAGHDWTSGGVTEGHLSHVVLSPKTGNYFDVKTRIKRNPVRWVERRQSAP